MYKEFFGITQKPFAITPDPNFLYMSDGHREALAHLRFGLEDDGGFVLLTGEVGTGKTTVCRCLLDQVPDNTTIAFIFNPKLTSQELLASICDELKIGYAPNSTIKGLVDALNRYLLAAHAKGRLTVLIIDEAQNLNVEVLEQIRLLTNLETNRKKLIHVILLGQPELGEKLSRPELRQLDQRISARNHLGPLSLEETKAYVGHRLSVVGMNASVFANDSLNQLYNLSAGIPRVINMICDRSLLGAYTKGVRTVDKGLLTQAADEVFGKPVKETSPVSVPRWLIAGLTVILCAVALFLVVRQDSGLAPLPQKSTTSAEVKKKKPAAQPTVADSSHKQQQPAKSAATTAKPAPRNENARPPLSKITADTHAKGTNVSARKTNNQASAVARSSRQQTSQVRQQPQPTARGSARPNVVTRKPVTRPSAQQPPVQPVPAASQVSQVQPKQPTPAPVTSQQTKSSLQPPAQQQPARSSIPPQKMTKPEWPTGELAGKSEYLAYEILFKLWGVNGYSPGDEWACEFAEQNDLYCLAEQGSIESLVRLNRPALLRMVNDQHQVFFMVLTSVRDDYATFRLGDQEATIPLAEIALNWSGVYVLLWQPPPGYSDSIRPGHKGPEVSWLAEKLSIIAGEQFDRSKVNDVYEGALVGKIRKFQFANNLVPDGIVGKETIIFINTLAGNKIPVLQKRK